MTSYPAQYFGSATPIINQTNVGSNTLSAQITSGGGGGGGGGGTDIIVSSITINSTGLGGQYFPYNNTSTTALAVGGAGNLIIVNQQGGVNPALTSGAQINTGEIILSGLTGDFGSQIQARVGADGQGNVQISSLMVSSINGATPGTAILPNQVSFSSINLNSQGYIEMFQNNANESARIIGYGDVNNVSSISLGVSFVPNYNSKVNGTDGLWTVENDAFGANQAFGDFGAGRLVVLGNLASISKPPPVLDGNGAGNLNINADGAVNISTTAFTVNGAPVGGSAPFFSTLNQSPQAIDCDGQTTTILLNFSTIVNHLYMIQTQMTVQPRVGQPQRGTQEDTVIQEILNELDLNQTVGSLISSMDAANTDLRIGTTGMWRANQTGQSLDIYTTFSTTVQLNDVYLTDFGAV